MGLQVKLITPIILLLFFLLGVTGYAAFQESSAGLRPLFLFTGIAASLFLVLILVLAGILVRSIRLCSDFARDVAIGKLDGVLPVYGGDESGRLADSLRAIPDQLRRLGDCYSDLEKKIEAGQLTARGDATRFSGIYARLLQDVNSIINRIGFLLDSMPSPVIIYDKEARAVYQNSVAITVTGPDYVGKTSGQLVAPENYDTPECPIRRARETRKPASAETRVHPNKDLVLDLRMDIIPLLDSRGGLLGLLQLATNLTELKQTQRTILQVANQATDISERLSASSGHLAARVKQVSRGADVQRDRLASTAASMDQMNSTVIDVARNAGAASEQAEATRLKAREGAALVDQVIAGITEVNSVAQELHGNMRNLGVQAEAIGGVMNVISDIADQTNLLALNAAIEAARAGEAGRGFAVVADEVRKLAEKTMSATTEVGNSIRGIQSATSANLARVSDATTSVSRATELASTSGEALKEIVSLAAKSSSLITSIAAAAEEQSATSDEIRRGVDEISKIADDTAAGMEQSAGAVQEVSKITLDLRAALERLRS